MRWAWLVLTATACNDLYGLHATSLRTAPTSCPELGTPPRYAPAFVQMIVADCTQYTPSAAAGLAVAGCATDRGSFIASALIGDDLNAIDVPPVSSCVNLEYARLVPEGDRLYVDENNYDCDGNDTFGEYVMVDATHWTYVRDVGIPPTTDTVGQTLGAVSAAPDRRALVTTNADGVLHEWAQQSDGTWQERLPAYTASELGIDATGVYGAANLTADGLRVVFPARTANSTTSNVYYADRASRDERFGPASPLDGVPGNAADPLMIDDCTRVYFSGLGRIFYAEEQ